MSSNDLFSLDTPCLLLHQGKFEHNIDKMYQKCQSLEVSFRPHVKTAKSNELLAFMRRAPQLGITVSTLKEAEYFFAHEECNILYAVTIAPNKIDRALSLCREAPKFTLLVDNIEVCKQLAAQAERQNVNVNLMIEIDVDGHRAGLIATDPLLVELATLIETSTYLHFQGLMTHAGESYGCESSNQLLAHANLERDQMLLAKQHLLDNAIQCPCLSIGSTPTANTFEDLTGIDEVRAGVFVFYDLVMANIGVCDISDIALGVLTTIISHKYSHQRLIVDAGGLALSKDRGTASQQQDYGYGLVVDPITWQPYPDLIVSQANQEHGIIELTNIHQFDAFPVGKKLLILPNHACMTAAGYNEYKALQHNGSIKTYSRINGW